MLGVSPGTASWQVRFTDIPAPSVDAYQNLVEFGALWEHVAARPHARVVEIGSLFGGTLFYWSHLPNIETLLTVDLPSDVKRVADGVRAARAQWQEWMPGLVDIQADSHDPGTVDMVRDALHGEPIDFLFVDGDHTYDGIRTDWELWAPLVRPGGVVALHDTWPNGARHEPGVVRFVDELRHQWPSIEWTDPDGVGITAFEVA